MSKQDIPKNKELNIESKKSIEDYADRKVAELTTKVETLIEEWKETGGLDAEITQINTYLENFKTAVNDIKEQNKEAGATKAGISQDFYEKNIEIDKVVKDIVDIQDFHPAPEDNDISEPEVAQEPTSDEASEEDSEEISEEEEGVENDDTAVESEEDSEVTEEENGPGRWAKWGDKINKSYTGAKEVLSTSAGRKMVAKGAYTTLATISGYKFATDIALAVGGKGDLYNYFKQKKDTKRERGKVMEIINDSSIENAQQVYKEKINNSENLSAEEKIELLSRLDTIMDEHEYSEKKILEERNEKIKKALDAYLQNKIKGAKIAKDAMYMALTVATLGSGSIATRAGAYGLSRASAYFMASAIERGQKASQQFDKDKVNDEVKGKRRINEIVRDVFVNSTRETLRSLAGKGKKEDSEHKVMDGVQALGTLSRAIGIVLTNVDLGEFKDGLEDNINNLLDNFEDEEATVESGNIEAPETPDVPTESLLDNAGVFISSEAQIFMDENNIKLEDNTLTGLKDMPNFDFSENEDVNLSMDASGNLKLEITNKDGQTNFYSINKDGEMSDAKVPVSTGTTEPTEAQAGIKQGPTETGEPLGEATGVQGPPAPEDSGDIAKPLKFEDTIDSSEEGMRGSDSIWKSTKNIFEKHSKELGYDGKPEDVGKWAETQTANAVATLNQEQGGNLNDLVHDNDKVILEIKDGKPHLRFEASSGIDAGQLSDTNVSKLLEGQEFKGGVEAIPHIDTATGDEYLEINDGEDTYKVYDWDRDGKPNVIMPDGSEQEMSVSELQDLLDKKGLLAVVEETAEPEVEAVTEDSEDDDSEEIETRSAEVSEPEVESVDKPSTEAAKASETAEKADGDSKVETPTEAVGSAAQETSDTETAENLPEGNFVPNPDLPPGVKLSIPEGVEKFLEDHNIEFKEGKLIGLKNIDKLSFDTVGELDELRKVEFVHFFEEGDGSIRVEVIGDDKIDNFKISQDREWSEVPEKEVVEGASLKVESGSFDKAKAESDAEFDKFKENIDTSSENFPSIANTNLSFEDRLTELEKITVEGKTVEYNSVSFREEDGKILYRFNLGQDYEEVSSDNIDKISGRIKLISGGNTVSKEDIIAQVRQERDGSGYRVSESGEKIYPKADINKDGIIDKEEMDAALERTMEASEIEMRDRTEFTSEVLAGIISKEMTADEFIVKAEEYQGLSLNDEVEKQFRRDFALAMNTRSRSIMEFKLKGAVDFLTHNRGVILRQAAEAMNNEDMDVLIEDSAIKE